MTAVPDASPLIALSKIERVDLLCKLYGKVLVTPRVWRESIVQGRNMGAKDVVYLEKAVQRFGMVRVRLTVDEEKLARRLKGVGTGSGEAEVVSIAKSRNALAILDDKDARAVAVGLDIDHTGTAGVLYEAFVRKLLSFGELLELLEKLGKVAWISPDLLAGIIRRASEVKDK